MRALDPDAVHLPIDDRRPLVDDHIHLDCSVALTAHRAAVVEGRDGGSHVGTTRERAKGDGIFSPGRVMAR